MDQKFFDLGYEAGMGDFLIIDLARQFQATHPDNWEEMLEQRLKEKAAELPPDARAQKKNLTSLQQRRDKLIELLKRLQLRGAEEEGEYIDRFSRDLLDLFKGPAVVSEPTPVPDLGKQ